MITFKNTLWLFMLAVCSVLVSCGDDSKDPSPVKKSNAKAITSFKFSGLDPEVTGTISEAEKKISLTVPHGTDVTKLTPTIVVSGKAAVTPGSGTPANFTTPVTYTVEAEDGSEQDYTVTVTISAINSPVPTITNIDKTTVAPGETLVITGNNFAESGNEVRFEAEGFSFGAEIVSESSTSIEIVVPETISDGEHTLLVIVNEVEVEYSQMVIIGEPSLEPNVSSINKITFNRGETIVITGEHLNSQDVSTYLYFWPSNGLAFQRVVSVSEDGTEISYTIPEDFTPGEYELEVYVNFEPVNYIVDIVINE